MLKSLVIQLSTVFCLVKLSQGLEVGIDSKTVQGSTSDEECGIYSAILHKNENSDNDKNMKIIAGQNTHNPLWRHHRWPWMGMVKNATHDLCNGILIKKNFILTTASCANGQNAKSLEVDLHGATYKVDQVISHEGFRQHRPMKLTGDLSLIKLKDHVPVSDDSRKSMSICLPRSKKQPLYAQECAVSFLWSKANQKLSKAKHRNKEVDTSAAWFDLADCSKIKEKEEFGNDSLLQCIQTVKDLKPEEKSSQVVYFFTCKMSGYWSVFGLSKNQEHVSKRHKKAFSYFLTLTHYLGWIKKKLYSL